MFGIHQISYKLKGFLLVISFSVFSSKLISYEVSNKIFLFQLSAFLPYFEKNTLIIFM